jgi:hypothetical protein
VTTEEEGVTYMTGLNVPRGWGRGSRPTRLKVVHPGASHGVHKDHRWVRAEDARAEDRVLGSRGNVYRVLGKAWTDDHRVVLTVEAPSGHIRTWIRTPRFSMERP